VPAAKVEHRANRQPGSDLRMRQQRVADRAGDAVAKRDQMRLEPLGIAVEHRSYVALGRAARAGQGAGRNHQVPHVWIVRAKLVGVLVGRSGLVMTAQAGQCMSLHAEGAGIGDPQLPRLFGQPVGLGEIAAAQAQQDCGVAQGGAGGKQRDAIGQDRQGGIGVADGLQRDSQGFPPDRVRRSCCQRFRQAGHCIGDAAKIEQRRPQHRLGLRICGVEDDGFRCVPRRPFGIVQPAAHIGAAFAQVRLQRQRRNGGVQVRLRPFPVAVADRQPCSEDGQLRRWRRHAARRRDERPCRADAAGVDQCGCAGAQRVGIGGNLDRVHQPGLLLSR
jgi:hypothetical protein